MDLDFLQNISDANKYYSIFTKIKEIIYPSHD